MNSIDEILDEVARATELNNGNIIARACASVGVSCPKCSYPTNAQLFDTLLYEYSRMRINTHHYKQRIRYWSEKEIASQFDYYTMAMQSSMKYKLLRLKLQDIWPCDDCTQLYNPTGRVKLVTRNKPQKQGVLDYV